MIYSASSLGFNSFMILPSVWLFIFKSAISPTFVIFFLESFRECFGKSTTAILRMILSAPKERFEFFTVHFGDEVLTQVPSSIFHVEVSNTKNDLRLKCISIIRPAKFCQCQYFFKERLFAARIDGFKGINSPYSCRRTFVCSSCTSTLRAKLDK